MNSNQQSIARSSLSIVQSIQLFMPNDFITSIKHNPTSALSYFIHESNQISIFYGLSLAEKTSMTFQTNIYDVLGVGETLIVSNKNMPVRVFQNPKQNEEASWASIYDRKPNSELFLTPLQFCRHGDRIVGGGKKFASEYDLCKLTAKRIKQLDKKYISSVQLLNSNVLATGQFTGTLQILDLRSFETISSTKPHVDLITHIVRRPLWEHQFVTLARKDNYSYLWDARNLKAFVEFYQHQRHGNQRTGLQVSVSGRYIYFGGQKGELFIQDVKQCIQSSFEIGQGKCLNSICQLNEQQLLCSAGGRSFPMQDQPQSFGHIFRLRHEYS